MASVRGILIFLQNFVRDVEFRYKQVDCPCLTTLEKPWNNVRVHAISQKMALWKLWMGMEIRPSYLHLPAGTYKSWKFQLSFYQNSKINSTHYKEEIRAGK